MIMHACCGVPITKRLVPPRKTKDRKHRKPTITANDHQPAQLTDHRPGAIGMACECVVWSGYAWVVGPAKCKRRLRVNLLEACAMCADWEGMPAEV